MTQTHLEDKALLVVVTRNNHVLLRHFIESLEQHDAGFPYDLRIVDHASDDRTHRNYLDTLTKYKRTYSQNDRVERSFNMEGAAARGQYAYYMFFHDDTHINEDGWLKKHIDRLKSGYCETVASDLSHLPIGRVGNNHQPWRDYHQVIGQPIGLDSVFLRDSLQALFSSYPSKYKFVDPERVLYTGECLAKVGVLSVASFADLKQEGHPSFEKVCQALNKNLNYYDEGIAPKNYYPEGECWNKLTMLSEFLNSVRPLMLGYRSVGLEGDGYVEQVDGFDEPWGHKCITHYGSPNMKRFLAKQLNTTPEEIHKRIYGKSRTFLLQCDRIIQGHFK